MQAYLKKKTTDIYSYVSVNFTNIQDTNIKNIQSRNIWVWTHITQHSRKRRANLSNYRSQIN